MIPHNSPTLGIEEMHAASRVIDSGWVAQGREVEEFEKEFCEYLGLPEGHAVMVSSGTAALYLAIEHLKKDRFGFPAYTCSSVRNAILMAGCEAVPMDVYKSTPNLDVVYADRKNVDALIIPHMFGIPASVMEAQTKPYIEDAAQSLGAKIGGISVGTSGVYGVFSFSATKMITSGGQGGAIVSRNRDRIDQIRDYREFDMREDVKQRFNFQMTDIQAAIGRVQLSKINSFIERREEIFQRYVEAGFTMMRSSDERYQDVRYRAVMITDRPLRIINSLLEAEIKAIIPIQEFELGTIGFHPQSFKLTYNTISLPIYPGLKDAEQDKIITVVKESLCL